MSLSVIGWGGVWSGFTWLRIGIFGGLLWMRWWSFRFWHGRVSLVSHTLEILFYSYSTRISAFIVWFIGLMVDFSLLHALLELKFR
jgi:hypothetical protein